MVCSLLVLAFAGCSSEPKVAAHGKEPGDKTAHGKSHDAGVDRGDDAGDMQDSGSTSSTRRDAGAQEPHAKPDASDEPARHPDACASSQTCTDAAASDHCGHRALKSNAHIAMHPANVLFVFDRSASMQEDWNGLPRWQAAGNAVAGALTPLADDFTAGALFFPSPDPDATCVDPTGITCMFVPGATVTGGCVVHPLAGADELGFMAGDNFLKAFVGEGTGPYAPISGGATPLLEALKEAKTALSDAALTGITTVVIITDGDPNCQWDADTAEAIVGDWHADGIDTYVFGLLGSNTANATVTLDMLADAAGTTFSTLTDATALEQQLSDVLSHALLPSLDSCSIELDDPAATDAELHVIVTRGGTPYEADSNDWSLASNRSAITLKGDLCTAAKHGEFMALQIVDGCVDLPALQP